MPDPYAPFRDPALRDRVTEEIASKLTERYGVPEPTATEAAQTAVFMMLLLAAAEACQENLIELMDPPPAEAPPRGWRRISRTPLLDDSTSVGNRAVVTYAILSALDPSPGVDRVPVVEGDSVKFFSVYAPPNYKELTKAAKDSLSESERAKYAAFFAAVFETKSVAMRSAFGGVGGAALNLALGFPLLGFSLKRKVKKAVERAVARGACVGTVTVDELLEMVREAVGSAVTQGCSRS